MSPVSHSSFARRRSFTLALLATTAVAAFLGGCNPSDHHLFASNSKSFPSETASLTGRHQNTSAVVGQWAAAYAKNPSDPKMALGYAYALKATGEKQGAFRVLKASFQANPSNGEIAANLGRVALELNQPQVAQAALHVASAQGVNDWRTLSAEGTLLAQSGDHAKAEQYFKAALKQKPDATSVINNLALSYALDKKPQEAEKLLKKAVANGAQDPRIRQNLALVLGLQGKFSQARQVASANVPPAQARENVAYIENMLGRRTQTASLERRDRPSEEDSAWQPFGKPDSSHHSSNAVASNTAPVQHRASNDATFMTASADEPQPPKVRTYRAAATPPTIVVPRNKQAPAPETIAMAEPPRPNSTAANRAWDVAAEIDPPKQSAPMSITASAGKSPAIAHPYHPTAVAKATASNSVNKTTRVAEIDESAPASSVLLRANLN